MMIGVCVDGGWDTKAGARETRAVCLSISVYLVGRVATAEPVAQDCPRRVEGGELLDGG